MKSTTQHQKYFIGKVCTVFTTQINRNFKEENPSRYPVNLYTYFVGFVEDIDEAGILLKQASTGHKTYLFMHNVVAVAEEVLEEIKPEDIQILNKSPAKESDIDSDSDEARLGIGNHNTDASKINIEALSKLVAQTQESYGKKVQ